MQYNTVLYSAVLYSALLYSILLYSTVLYVYTVDWKCSQRAAGLLTFRFGD